MSRAITSNWKPMDQDVRIYVRLMVVPTSKRSVIKINVAERSSHAEPSIFEDNGKNVSPLPLRGEVDWQINERAEVQFE